ncbi:1-acyl-sn-glycerol-3-phosphate acyltransferase [Anaplasma marginale str. Dawn]|nr:1-acyl-sn-glycerol-3-phosphate acyltransferase [Anaplasma marginale str. Gypsy Plains]AGZ80009.1 1-acyl-sn-glycerol-3-phosphate acyltransferase [Anaplasma marginale str. Dawn]
MPAYCCIYFTEGTRAKTMAFYILSALFTILYGCVLLPIVWFIPASCQNIACVWWTRVILWMCKVIDGISYEIIGRDCLPKGQFIVASAHQSPLETLILYAEFRDVVTVMKKELKTLPILGMVFMALKMVFVDRGKKIAALRKMVRECEARAKEGRTLVLFPQGTSQLRDMHLHRGVAAVYSRVFLPVVPIVLDTGNYWPGKIFTLSKKRGKAKIRILPAIAPGLESEELMARLLVALQSQP